MPTGAGDEEDSLQMDYGFSQDACDVYGSGSA